MPLVIRPQLPAFEPSDLPSLERAFQSGTRLDFGQAWRQKPEPAFREGWVRIEWRDNVFCLFATLVDSSIRTSATEDHQRLWELGDVFEIFLSDVRYRHYVELHVAPNGRRLQLRYPEAPGEDGRLKGAFEECRVLEPVFDFRVFIERQCWHVWAEVPAATVIGTPEPLAGKRWRVSFGRYDYGDSGAPVLSSTSPHAVVGFHRVHEWKHVTFRR